MPHHSVVAALQSFKLSADLLDDALILWAQGRIARAGALAVFSIEADAKANEWIADVTGLGVARNGPHHARRIDAALASLGAIFNEDQLASILGTEAAVGLSHDMVWEIRQRALFIDMNGDVLLTPDRIEVDRVAALLAAVGNIVKGRLCLGVDAEMLTDFFTEYGDIYRATSARAAVELPDWDAEGAMDAALSEHWIVPDAESPILRRREGLI